MKNIFIYFLLLMHVSLTCMHTIDLSKKTNNDLYVIMEKAEQHKNRPLYKQCIATILLPELCKKIDGITAQLKNKIIREALMKTKMDVQGDAKLFISDNGHYLAHITDYRIALIDIEKNNIIATLSSGTRKKPVYFSHNNEYCVTRSGASQGIWQTTYLYNFIQNHQYCITPEIHEHCFGITISQDSQHILYEDANGGSLSHYTLYTLDAEKKPQEVILKNKCLMGSKAVIFHPDNKHIIHNLYEDKLYSYNIETSENKIVSPVKNEKAYCIDKLTVTSGNKKIIAKTRFSDDQDYDTHKYILFNIENLDKVTSVTIPEQSCGTKKQLPVISIPHKNMVTHITNKGQTLQLLDDETLQCRAAHHTKENIHITTLAVDNTGNYLAAGYSDGTIMIWHLFDIAQLPNEKIFIDNRGALYPITDLTFGDNQLLSLIKFEPWDLNNPATIFGNATLWDVYGNEIIDFGDNTLNSIMSPNGKTIVTISAQLRKTNDPRLSGWQRDLTLNMYHDKNKTQDTADNDFTLSQLYMLMTKGIQ